MVLHLIALPLVAALVGFVIGSSVPRYGFASALAAMFGGLFAAIGLAAALPTEPFVTYAILAVVLPILGACLAVLLGRHDRNRLKTLFDNTDG